MLGRSHASRRQGCLPCWHAVAGALELWASLPCTSGSLEVPPTMLLLLLLLLAPSLRLQLVLAPGAAWLGWARRIAGGCVGPGRGQCHKQAALCSASLSHARTGAPSQNSLKMPCDW